MKEIYIKENGRIVSKESVTDDNKANYLSVSDMFEGIVPLRMSELDTSEIEYFFKSLKTKNYKYYKFVIDTLMNKIITCKDYDDLSSNRKSSFYTTLKNEYTQERLTRKIDSKHKLATLEKNKEFMCTAVRLVIRNYIETVIDGIKNSKEIEDKEAYDVMKIGNKKLSEIKNRLNEDVKMDNFIKGVYNEKTASMKKCGTEHLCNKCHFKSLYDCPKVQHVVPDCWTIDSDDLKFITDGKQVVNVDTDEYGNETKSTEMCLITGCRRYWVFEAKHKKQLQEKANKDKTRSK